MESGLHKETENSEADWIYGRSEAVREQTEGLPSVSVRVKRTWANVHTLCLANIQG